VRAGVQGQSRSARFLCGAIRGRLPLLLGPRGNTQVEDCNHGDHQGAPQDGSAGSKAQIAVVMSSAASRTYALFSGLRISLSALSKNKLGKTSLIARVSQSILFALYNLGAYFVSKFYGAIFRFSQHHLSLARMMRAGACIPLADF